MGKYVSTYFSPNRGAADTLIGFIGRCEHTLDAAVYSITHDGIRDALIAAHNRGVRVRILTDSLQAKGRYSDDEALEDSGIAVLRDTQSGSMHNKVIIGDGKAVGTGSFNWSKNADKRNAENFLIVRLTYVV
ncbi:MAG TPA: phospholipase D family protein, partial [Phycisphaerales bacterium]|nr:phospholipase D family protein [Phycisphaerales bacterium]